MNVTFYNFTLTVINSIVTTYIFVGLVEFNATFNNSLVILWWSVLLVEKTTDLSPVTDKFYHIMLYTTPWSRFELTTSVVIDTGYISSQGERANTGWLGIRIMCPSRATCMSIGGLLFQWASTIKIQLSVLV